MSLERKEKEARPPEGTEYEIRVHLFETGSAAEIGKDVVTISATKLLAALREAVKTKFDPMLAMFAPAQLVVKPTRDGAPLDPGTRLWEVQFELDTNKELHACVEVPPKPETRPPDKRARTALHEWDPTLATYKTVGALPLPTLETSPEFIAPATFLAELQTQVIKESKNVEIGLPYEYRTRPLCVARCSRGGKTRALNELAHRLKEAGMPVIFVTFGDWATLGVNSAEQRNPLQALLIRIAFLATHEKADWTPNNFCVFRSNYHVSSTRICEWLKDSPCVLIIDEMNNAVKLLESSEEGDTFGQFLRGTFLMPANRAFVFSSHVVTLVTKLHSFVEASNNHRGVLVKTLPKISSLQVAQKTLGKAFPIQKLLYFGLIPALVHTRHHRPPWSVQKKGEFTDAVICNLFRSFFTAEAMLVHPELLKFMDTIAENRVVWILSHMHMVFEALARHLGGTEMGNQLHDLCDLIKNFADPNYQSGDGFEFLFACVFLLRVGCGYPCEPFFPTSFSTTRPCSFSYNRYMKSSHGAPEFCKLQTWADLESVILPPTPEQVTFPHVAYYLPLHVRFEKYDGFARMYSTPSDYETLAFQLKRGKGTPDKHANEPDLKAFIVRGWPSSLEQEIRGWRFVSGPEQEAFFGESGKQWAPEHLDALLK